MTISLQNRTNKYKTEKVLHADPSRYLSVGTGPRTSRRISKSNQCSEFAHPLGKSELLLLRNPFLCCARASQPWQSSPLPSIDQLDTSAPCCGARSQRVRKRRKLMSVEERE